MDPRGGLKANVKLSIPHACHSERSEKTLSFAVRDSRFSHMCREPLRFPLEKKWQGRVWGSGYSREGVGFAATMPMTIHAAPFSPSFLWKEVPRRGGGWPRETVLPHSGKPTPPRFAHLPLPWKGARMIFKEALIQSLSFAVRLSRFPHICHAFLRFPHLSFMPLVPYPPLRGTFPSRGRLTIREQHPLKSGEAASFPFEPFEPSEPIEPASPLHCQLQLFS